MKYFTISWTGQKEIGPGYVQPCISTSYVNEINPEPVPDIGDIPQNNHVGAEMYIERDSHGSRFPVTQGGHSIENLTNVPPLDTTWEFDFLDEAEFSTCVEFLNSVTGRSSSGKPKAVWCKILAVIKWGISVRKVTAGRRNY
jgi:hypothetical protein